MFTSKAQFPYPGGYVNLTNKAYIDGNLVNEGKNLITKVKFFIFQPKILLLLEMRTIIKSNYEELPRYVDVILGQRYKQDKNEFLQEESFRSVLLLRYLWFVTKSFKNAKRWLDKIHSEYCF